jgi:restriction system protein
MLFRSLSKFVVNSTLYAMAFGLIGVALVIMIVREHPIATGIACIIIVVTQHLVSEGRRKKFEMSMNSVISKVDMAIQRHQGELVSLRNRSISYGNFRTVNSKEWHKIIRDFLENHASLDDYDQKLLSKGDNVDIVISRVDQAVAEIANRCTPSSAGTGDVEMMDGHEYERHCARLLQSMGWAITLTPTTGDHGADLVATHGAVRLIVQCKKYATPVGNSAVQEVHSASTLYNGNAACVVAPSGYTKQARIAAHAHGVRLLHHLDLPAFAGELMEASPRTVGSKAGLRGEYGRSIRQPPRHATP